MIVQLQNSLSDNSVVVIPTGPEGGSGGGGGSVGPVGPQGAQGAQGRQGAQGFQGNSGTGSQGPQGSQGAGGPGAQGSQGVQGSRGSTGFQGPSGSGYSVNTIEASSTATYARSNDSTYDDVDSMSVTVNTSSNAWIVLFFTATIQATDNTKNFHAVFRFVLDGTVNGPPLLGIRRDTPPVTGEINTVDFHYAYQGLLAGTHTVKVQISNDSTSQTLQVGERRLTATMGAPTTGSGSNPGGSNSQIQYNNNGVFGGFGSWSGSTLGVPSITVSGQAIVPPVALTPGSIVTWDMNAAPNATLVASSSFTLNNPTNIVSGGSGMLTISQDSTGGRVITWGSNYRFPGGTKFVLSTAANAVDQLGWYSPDGSHVDIVGSQAFS